MIPLAVPDLDGNEARYLQECIETTYVSSVGPFVDRFEAMTAQATGAALAVATSSGTAGLHAALAAVGVARDDLVILPAYTFIASANAISLCGAIPWILDVDPASWTLDPTQLEVILEGETHKDGERLIHRPSGRRVAAVMPVYTFGLPAEMDQIGSMLRRLALPVVADAAAALGADFRGRALGELADLTVLSFNGNKTLTAGGGGAVVGSDETLLARVKHLTTTARRGDEYVHDEVGFNYRMTNLQAAVGCAQLERLEELLARKRAIRSWYRRELAGIAGFRLFPEPSWGRSSCWLSGLLLDPESPVRLRRLCEQLRADGIEASSFWKPIHTQPAYRDALRAPVLSVSESIAERILVLPSSSTLNSEEQAYVIEVVTKHIAEASKPD
jgi:dTDP-4-amino-4,6-dideoxygalactose transaminase